MKYFEFKEPYYALIVAENEEKAVEIYKEMVSDIDDEETFYSGMKEIDREYAEILYLEAKDEDGNCPTVEEFAGMKNDLLLIDASLI